MASIHAQHSRNCPLVAGKSSQWTSFAKARKSQGCKCLPLYYIVTRKARTIQRDPVGRDRQEAERRLDEVRVEVSKGVYRPVVKVKFETWGKDWIQLLRQAGLSPLTLEDYETTLSYAEPVFGFKYVRDITSEDIEALDAVLMAPRRDGREGCSPTTRAKHLRNLSACFGVAIEKGKAGHNPVKMMGHKPKAERKESAYFENAEVARLLPEIPGGLFRTLFETARMSGMRQGELVALEWGDVNLSEGVITVSKSYSGGVMKTPKSGKARRVYIPAELVKILGQWWGEAGNPADDTLVFPGRGGHLSAATLTKLVLYPAMKRAGVPREGPNGTKRTFHSFRHQYAKTLMEQGKPLYLISKMLGHSSLQVTERVYGHAEDAALAELVKSSTFDLEAAEVLDPNEGGDNA